MTMTIQGMPEVGEKVFSADGKVEMTMGDKGKIEVGTASAWVRGTVTAIEGDEVIIDVPGCIPHRRLLELEGKTWQRAAAGE
jgi:hypothetical protein